MLTHPSTLRYDCIKKHIEGIQLKLADDPVHQHLALLQSCSKGPALNSIGCCNEPRLLCNAMMIQPNKSFRACQAYDKHRQGLEEPCPSRATGHIVGTCVCSTSWTMQV